MLYTSFYFILALLLLIIVHESGHFLVARWCGVKVIRFSFGFGKILASWYDKTGTEYAWSLLPFGGYVKMLDEEEGDVPFDQRHMAFNNQSLLKRTAIVLAGPVFNFLLAFVLLWFVWVIGVKSLVPIIDEVYPDSLAARAGLVAKQEILFFDEKPMTSWRDFQYALMPLIGSQKKVAMTVRSLDDNKRTTIYLPLHQWQINPRGPDVLKSLGIKPFFPVIPAIVGGLISGSPAEKAGLQIDDVIMAIDGEKVDDWLSLVQFVRSHPHQSMTLLVKRHGHDVKLPMVIGQLEESKKMEGFLGVSSRPIDFNPDWLRVKRTGPIQAIAESCKQTVELTKDTFILIGRIISGHVSLENISGPVGIAQSAGESARNGFVYYLSFIALLSISLGVLNILPIPLLDGGHLFFYFIEACMGRPLSSAIKAKCAYLGLALLFSLTVIALTNDLSRM